MHVLKEKVIHAKSYTSIYDLFGSTPFNNILYQNKNKKRHKEHSIAHTNYDDGSVNNVKSNNSLSLNCTEYVTSEKYLLLNKEISQKSIFRSTSTIFYDLDDVAKRHSFHSINDTRLSVSNVNLLKVMKIPLNTNGFSGKSDAIVQECATQIQAKLVPRDSIVVNTKKIKRTFPDESFLSSEIFLRDDEYYNENKSAYYDKEVTDRQQKFWSFAKYRTEFTNPVPEEKKRKKKDRGKRTEDPCPCQLFSYACPCTDKKSLTELAKNSKSLTVADQITSTIIMAEDERKELRSNKTKKTKSTKEDKLLSTDYVEAVERYQVIPTKIETHINTSAKHDTPTVSNVPLMDNDSIRSKGKQVKKRRKITCPKCRESLDVVLSTTDEEESMKGDNSSLYHFNEISSKTGHKSSKGNRHISVIAEDNCGHDPRCELIPVCQILPTDNVHEMFLTHKCIKQPSNPKTTPKIIRITKACRHHPPCTVVPSCQRANVLKNNCEYVPPCLHRPRCVNLPLCVPFKNLHYEEVTKNADNENINCPHTPRCKLMPECHYESLGTLQNHHHLVSQVQNACEVLNEYQQPQYINSNTHGSQNPAPINNMPPSTPCRYCKSNKSCQFDCPDCNCASGNNNEVDSNDAVIFIRDVGCQFGHKRCPQKIEQPKDSSGSLDFVDVKMGNYYSNVHTLRYEDKCTNPMVEEFLSETSISITSLEVDSHCPTHGERALRKRSERASGFIPKQNTSPYVAYATQRSPLNPSQMYSGNNELNAARTPSHSNGNSTFSVKSQRNYMRAKYRKMFAVKRRKKSKASHHGFGGHSRKQVYIPNCD